jgi:NadR type nicotinamide-nucleotide adenylyltransferase
MRAVTLDQGMKKTETICKIALTGPESSGKTTLCQALSAYFRTVWTPEYARYYLPRLGRQYHFADLTRIGKGQLQWQRRDAGRARGVLFCDTDLISLKVWSDYRFGATDPWILDQLRQNPYDLTLLCHPDIPWEADPLRENPHDREALLLQFRRELHDRNIPFFEVSGGSHAARLAAASGYITEKFPALLQNVAVR